MRFSFSKTLPSIQQIMAWGARMGAVKIGVGAIVLVAALALFVYLLIGRPDGGETSQALPLVEVASIATLSTESSGLPLLGQVRSVSEATILTEVQGQVTRVNYALGDFVAAGAIIAEISNASERAAVAQARASLSEEESQSTRTEETNESSARNVYRNAFLTADDAVQSKTEPFFLNDRTQFPSLLIALPNDESLEEKRAEITEILRTWERAIDELSGTEDILPRLGQAKVDLSIIEDFLTELASAANRQTSNSSSLAITDADRTALQTARSNVSAALSLLITTEDTLRQSRLGTTSGATGEQEAQLAGARARVSTALASLERTIIRTPISGTINSLNVERGNFVSTQTLAVTIANNNALEIETSITAKDRESVAIGNPAIIDGRYPGTVTNIAPGLNPLTNKIKVEVALDGEARGLTHGDTVRISIERSTPSDELTGEAAMEFIVPITALKVETDRIVVFTVSPEGVLIAHPIIEGPLVGNSIVLNGGVTSDLEIVLDARGLNEGDQVEVAE